MKARLSLALVGVLLSGAALAQSVPLQGGPWVPGHLPVYAPANGGSKPMLLDSGPASGGGPSSGIAELLITARGVGLSPYAASGTGPGGSNFCSYDGPTTTGRPFHYLCLSANLGSYGAIAFGTGNGATALPLMALVNGTTVNLGALLNSIGTPTAGQLAQWTDASHIQGITLSGDGTVNTSTGALTIANGAVSAAKMASGAAAGNLGFATTNADGSQGSILSCGPTPGSLCNIVFGYSAMGASVTTGNKNAAFGINALQALTTGANNTAVGLHSQIAMTTGNSNTSLGTDSLSHASTPASNTAIGTDAAQNTNGASNTAIGDNSLSQGTTAAYNTLVGASSGFALDGTGNTTVGWDSLANATGNYNVSMGYQAGVGVTTGSRNILLGTADTSAASQGQVTTGSNNIAIGNNVAVPSPSASNQLSIGNFIYGTALSGTGASVSPGAVGFGKTNPAYPVDVAGDANISGSYRVNGTTVLGLSGSNPQLPTTTVVGLNPVATRSGVLTNGHCVSIDASGNFVDAGGACTTGGGGGTVNSGTAGQIAYYVGTGTAVSGLTTGTGVTTALGVNTGSSGAFVVNGGALGTPSSGTLTSATGLPISTGISGLGTGVATALAVNTGTAGSHVVNGGALGTPASGVLTNATGLPISTGLTGAGTGVLSALGSAVTGSGGIVLATSPVLTTPNLGTPSAVTLTNGTGLPLAGLASQAANTLVGALTATTPSAQAVPSCSTASSALTWTSGTGFGCNTISSGGKTLLTTISGWSAASATVQATSLATTYTDLQIILDGIQPGLSAAFQVEVSNDNGSTWELQQVSGSGFTSTAIASAGFTINGANAGSTEKVAFGSGRNEPTTFFPIGGRWSVKTGTINALRFSFSGGATFNTGGSIRIYGVP